MYIFLVLLFNNIMIENLSTLMDWELMRSRPQKIRRLLQQCMLSVHCHVKSEESGRLKERESHTRKIFEDCRQKCALIDDIHLGLGESDARQILIISGEI
jgi:hypothetical protein